MNQAIPLFALITCLGVGAQSNPPESPQTPETPDPALPAAPSVDVGPIVARAVAKAQETAEQALAQAQRAADQAMKQGRNALAIVQSKLADADSADQQDASEVQALGTFLDVVNPSSRSAGQSLVVQATEPEAGTVPRIQEDLTVMERILNKALEHEVGRQGHEAAMGIVLSALPGARRPQSLYLEGYGALFFVNVRFPLVAPPASQEEKSEKQTDTTWEETKRELYGPRSAKSRIFSSPIHESALEYRPEQVESLKKELLETLKNATNLRDVKSSENVTVAVIGGRANVVTARVVRQRNRHMGDIPKTELFDVTDDRRAPALSTMTIRVKKADVDAFANGELDFDQFQKRAAIATY